MQQGNGLTRESLLSPSQGALGDKCGTGIHNLRQLQQQPAASQHPASQPVSQQASKSQSADMNRDTSCCCWCRIINNTVSFFSFVFLLAFFLLSPPFLLLLQ
jgi:hypothetical protein